jgi:hypothetical protein
MPPMWRASPVPLVPLRGRFARRKRNAHFPLSHKDFSHPSFYLFLLSRF